MVLVAGCTVQSSAPPPATPAGTGTVQVVDVSGPATVQVRWDAIRSSSGCFFFGGPGNLARDDSLGTTARWLREGNALVLDFDGTRFEGDGTASPLVLRRSSQHDYQGKWDVTQTITLSPTSPGMLGGSYGYRECNIEDPSECPTRCTIEARLSLPAP
jgi:hypothetical protein